MRISIQRVDVLLDENGREIFHNTVGDPMFKVGQVVTIKTEAGMYQGCISCVQYVSRYKAFMQASQPGFYYTFDSHMIDDLEQIKFYHVSGGSTFMFTNRDIQEDVGELMVESDGKVVTMVPTQTAEAIVNTSI